VTRPILQASIAATVIAIAVSGCATRSFTMRVLPDETPAADNARAIQRVEAMQQSQQAMPSASSAPTQNGPPVTTADAPSMYTYDPWERMNRLFYRFNARFDENVFLPVADTYRWLPAFMRAGVHNFFGNLAEVPTVVNDLLQWRIKTGASSLGRFAVNSTIGIGGLFDVATRLHLQKAPATFGSTLSTWGFHPGPFLVVPILGPSTLREGVGYLGDYGISYGINVANLYRDDQSYVLDAVGAIDTRANLDFRYYGTGSPFEYENIRFLLMRKTLIEDEKLHPQGRPKDSDPTAPAGR
jgi:phospholipid-binding lipoprotein MlaA